MASLLGAVAVVLAYVGLLFLVALWAERQEQRGRRAAQSALVYSLSLATYCSTWTYYGSVGSAASSGLLFLGIYLGPTISAAFWSRLLGKMIRIRNAHRVTSVADLLSVRYGKAQSVAMLATVGLLLGLVPYLALQLKTMIATVAVITGRDAASMGGRVGPLIVLLMVLFTVVFGIRRLSPTERHPGMMVALATEGVVKLAGLVAAGAFVVYGLFDGPADLFGRAASAQVMPDLLGRGGSTATLLAYVLLSAVAVLLLPRQFHVAVVENADEGHVRTATWAFPAYLLAINVFVLPLALAGLLLGHPAREADTFVLTLPWAAGARGLSWLVFLGGFSAGTAMVMAETMTLATMVSNHLLLPAIDLWPRLGRLRRHLLASRWVAAVLLLLAALAYERALGSQYELVQIGLISFAAVLVLAPPLLGGLYWREASTGGALAGLTAGFAVWGYTLLVPVFVRAGWLPEGLLGSGPLGISLLRPEALFGLGGLDRIPHAVFWILLFDGGAFVLGSLLAPAPAAELARAQRLLGAVEPVPWMAQEPEGAGAVALAPEKRERMARLFARYHEEGAAGRLADACLARVQVEPGGPLSALQLAELEAEVETTLASSIGTAAAHAELRNHGITTEAEERAISAAYGQILAALKVPPAELQRKIDYHRERERLLAHEAATHRFLADVSAELAASLDVEATGRTVVRLAVPRFAEVALLWVAPAADEPRPRAWLAASGVERERQAQAAAEAAAPGLGNQASVLRALETGRTVVSRAGPAAAWPEGLRQSLPRGGEITFPLGAGGRTLGALVLFLSEPDQLQSADDLALAEELARRSAVALVNAALFRSAEEAVKARDEFLAVASHELKTPLTPLRLSIQAVQRLVSRGELLGDQGAHLGSALQRADGQIRRLVRLVDYLLDVSRITTRRLRLQLEPTDLSAAVQEVLERHRSELQQAGCTVSVAAASGAVGRWDRLRIEQVVTNLLTNAMKYAPGPIDVAVDAEGDVTRLVVRDRGPGIAREDQERIFLPFERAVSYLRASGFGLGLFIVRQIVDAHGGTVRLASAPGEGSTFTVELPRQPPASA